MSFACKVVLETFWYVLFGGLVTGVFVLAAIIPFIVTVPFLGGERVVRAYGRFVVFIVLLTTFGLCGHLFFALALRGNLYIPADSVIDFLPYFPSVNLAVDESCGGRLAEGVTPAKFRLAWLAVALPIWLATIATFRALWRRSCSWSGR